MHGAKTTMCEDLARSRIRAVDGDRTLDSSTLGVPDGSLKAGDALVFDFRFQAGRPRVLQDARQRDRNRFSGEQGVPRWKVRQPDDELPRIGRRRAGWLGLRSAARHQREHDCGDYEQYHSGDRTADHAIATTGLGVAACR